MTQVADLETSAPPTGPRFFTFAAGSHGPWRIERVTPIAGESLLPAARLHIVEDIEPAMSSMPLWTLRGVTSHLRYTTQAEAAALAVKQEELSRPQASCAALIPIRKSAAWWALAQDQRRALLEDQSHHIGIGMEYLPAIARRLHHSRELGEPFDFLTWFEYAPEHGAAFEEMVKRLRASPEWRYVDREVDIRLRRAE